MTSREWSQVGLISQLRFVLGGQGRFKWIVLVLFAVAISGVEVISAALVYLLIGRVTSPDTTIDLPIIGDPIRFLGSLEEEQVIYALTGGIALFFVIRGAFLVLQKYVQARVVYNSSASVSNRLTKGYLDMPYAEHLRRNSAELVRNAFFNVQVLSKLLNSAVKVVAETFVVTGLVVAMLLIAPIVTLVAVGLLGPIMFALLWTVKSRMKEYGHGTKEMEREGLGIVQEGLAGIRDIRLLGAETWFSKSFARTRRLQADYMVKYAAVGEMPRVVIETFLVFMIAGFFAVVTAFARSDATSLSTLGLFAYAGVRLKPSIQAITAGINDVRHHMPSLFDISRDLKAAKSAKSASRERTSLTPIPRLTTSITLSGVGYTYAGSATPALFDIDMEIKRGDSIGFVGSTGGGKSTLVDVVAGLLPPTRGVVSVDGLDLNSGDLASWYQQLGVVSQSIFVMDATMRENIAFGIPEPEIDELALAEAVRVAQLEDVVRELPEGLASRLGEHGTRLSGGQRQRVAIARALYRRPEVLILDEGTAALDNTTESKLVHALTESRGTMTLIVVAHRLSTVKQCDRVFVIDQGSVLDSGTFDDLLDRQPIFASMRMGSATT